MKLSRREFLKWLGIGAAGAALAPVIGLEGLPGPVHELVPFIWTKGQSAPPHELLDNIHCDFQVEARQPCSQVYHLTCAGIPVDADVVQEIVTGYTDTEFDSTHNLGLEVGNSMPASLTLECDGQTFLHACGNVHLRGFTAGWDTVVYHYYFWGCDVESGVDA